MVDLSHLCLGCFKDKGNYKVCPYCGYRDGEETAQSHYLQPGMILTGRYIIGTVVGFGGFGITYKAYDAKLDMVVAIKEFYPIGIVNRIQGSIQVEIFTRSQEDTYLNMLERFREEARNMAIFSKEPDIVTVYDCFEENGTAYIVMEYIEGIRLKEYLKYYGRMSQEDAVPLFLDILQTIGKLHANGIIHKDISPDNLFIQEGNKVKLFDFGAANFQGKNDEVYHDVVIKAGYAPPEQYRKDNVPKPTLDIYAAGALLYEMVTGECPLEATDRSVQDDIVPPTQKGAEIEQNLENAILKALALDPEQRFQSVEEFYDTVKENLHVEVPKGTEGKKKYLVIQRVMLGILSAAAVAAGAFIFRYQMDIRNYKPKEGTDLNVWMTKESGESAQEQEISKNLKIGFEDKYPNVNVNITFVPEEEYQKKLETAAENELPDVFWSGQSENVECADLSPVVKYLDDVDYLFEEQYEDSYPEKEQIPLGFQMAVYYRNESKEAFAKDSIALSDVRTAIGEEKCKWITPDGKEGGKQKTLKQLTNAKSPLNSVVGSLSCWNEVQDYVVSSKRKNMKILPVVEEDYLLCSFQEVYSVRKSGDKNREKTAMLFLYYLLGNMAQQELGSRQNDMVPVNAKAYRSYMDNLTQYSLDYIEEIIRVTEEEEQIKYSVSYKVRMDDSGKEIYDIYGK